MTTTASLDRLILLRHIQHSWRGWLHGGLLLVLGLWVVSGVAIPRLAASASMQALADVLTWVRLVCSMLLGGYVGWWLLVLGETLLLRRATPPATPGVLHQIRLPRPQGSRTAQAAISASGARAGLQDADVIMDALRGLLAQLTSSQCRHMSLELWRSATSAVRWNIWMPDTAQSRISLRALWAGATPGSDVREVADPLADPSSGVLVWAECHLRADSAYPLRLHEEHTGDPMAPLLGALTPQAGVMELGFQVLLRPAPAAWQRHTRRAQWLAQETARQTRDGDAKQTAQSMETKGRDAGATACVRIIARAETEAAGRTAVATVVGMLDSVTITRGTTVQGWEVVHEAVVPGGTQLPAALRDRRITSPARRVPLPLALGRTPGVLVPAELATHWHLPSERYAQLADWRMNTFLPPAAGVLREVLTTTEVTT